MSIKIDVDSLSAEIQKAVTEYADSISDDVKKAVDNTASELLENIKKDAPEKSGKYKKAMKLKTDFENRTGKRVLWYVKSPHYRLSHLLEKGHVKRNGGRVRAYPHIQKNEDIAKTSLEKRIVDAISKRKG